MNSSRSTLTTRALSCEMVTGRLSRKAVPAPGALSTSTEPPRLWMASATTSSPTPRPARLDTEEAVEKLGMKMSRRSSSSLMPSVSTPRVRALRAMAARSRPRPSSTTAILTRPETSLAASSRLASSGLPAARRCFRLLDAVGEGVAHHVQQGLVQPAEHPPVEGGLGPLDGELHVLAALAGQVAHVAAKAHEQRGDRHQPDAQQLLAQPAGGAAQRAHHGVEGGQVRGAQGALGRPAPAPPAARCGSPPSRWPAPSARRPCCRRSGSRCRRRRRRPPAARRARPPASPALRPRRRAAGGWGARSAPPAGGAGRPRWRRGRPRPGPSAG